jgi:lysozyme family protein
VSRTVEQIIEGVIEREGGYVDHPSDRGGPTMYGITEAVARQAGYTGPMQELPRELARQIYRERYYRAPGFYRVALLTPGIAEELTDTGVNMGPERAVKFLQRALSALNLEQKLYPDLVVDGQLGDKTLGALKAYLAHRKRDGVQVLLLALNCLQGARYIELTEARPANEDFVFGWLRERIAL